MVAGSIGFMFWQRATSGNVCRRSASQRLRSYHCGDIWYTGLLLVVVSMIITISVPPHLFMFMLCFFCFRMTRQFENSQGKPLVGAISLMNNSCWSSSDHPVPCAQSLDLSSFLLSDRNVSWNYGVAGWRLEHGRCSHVPSFIPWDGNGLFQ
jgi:hypothetical protein